MRRETLTHEAGRTTPSGSEEGTETVQTSTANPNHSGCLIRKSKPGVFQGSVKPPSFLAAPWFFVEMDPSTPRSLFARGGGGVRPSEPAGKSRGRFLFSRSLSSRARNSSRVGQAPCEAPAPAPAPPLSKPWERWGATQTRSPVGPFVKSICLHLSFSPLENMRHVVQW